MQVYFKKTIGKYKKGQLREIPNGLAQVYIRSNIASQDYEKKVIESVSREEFKESLDAYDSMDLEQLKDLANKRDIKFHHRAGAERLKQLLRESGELAI